MHYFEEFYINLMYGYSTNDAFVNGKGFFIGSYIHDGKLCTYKYSRYGSKLVYYPMPHATGVGKRNNMSNARTRSSEDEKSAIIVNAQIRYPSEESDDILKNIEAGICLQDMDTKEVTLIPFSDKNIVSNEKKVYGGVTVSNIAISLDDLTEGHQYAYCCYTKTNEIVKLSDECYKITKDYYLRIYYSYHTDWSYSYKYSYNDGRVDEESYLQQYNSDTYFWVYKIEGQYYIEYGLCWPRQLNANNSIEEYHIDEVTTEYTTYNNISGTAQCEMKKDNIHIKISSSYETTTLQSGDKDNWNDIIDITLNNIDTNPIVTWNEDISKHRGYSYREGYSLYSIGQFVTCNHVVTDIERGEVPLGIYSEVPSGLCKIIH